MNDIVCFMPTSAAPWNPEMPIITTAIRGVRELCGDIPIHVYCDGPDPWRSDEEIDNYKEHIQGVKDLGVSPVVEMSEWVGLAGMVDRFCQTLTDQKIVVNMQHDWELLGMGRVAYTRLFAEMRRPRSPVRYVRFHRKPLTVEACSRYYRQYAHIDPPDGLALIASNGWGDSPHIATAEHYRTMVLPNIIVGSPRDGRFGVERPVWGAYRTAIRKMGFAAAHRLWGSWFYGHVGDAPYMQHIGRAQAHWRRRNGLAQG